MLKNEALLVLVVLVSCLVPLGCATKNAPDCSDNKTKEIVLKKILIHPTYVGAKSKGTTNKSEQEFEKEFLANANLSYSNGVLTVSEKQNPDYKVRFSLFNTRTTNIIKGIGKYECAAELTAERIDKEHSEALAKQEITYTSELADNGKKHFVTIKMTSHNSF